VFEVDVPGAAPRIARDPTGAFAVVWQWSTFGPEYLPYARLYASTGAPLGVGFRLSNVTSTFPYSPTVAVADGGFAVSWSHSGIHARFLDSAGNPASEDFRVDESGGLGSSVAAGPAGRYLVGWERGAAGIYARRLAKPPPVLGSEFRVNTATTGNQRIPRVAQDSAGAFVVTWTTYVVSEADALAQRYSSAGVPLGTEFLVHASTNGYQNSSDVALSPSGAGFTIVWADSAGDGGGYGIRARRFAADGQRLGVEVIVNTYTPGTQTLPRIASLPSGDFIVVWMSQFQDGSDWGVYGQRFASSGAPAGGEFRVSTDTAGYQGDAAVGAAAGGFVVAWESDDGSTTGIRGQRYSSAGPPVGPEFRINTHTLGDQSLPAVAVEAAGGFTVVWQSDGLDGDIRGISARRYASSGAPLTDEFQVNTYTTGIQAMPSISGTASGDFAVTWSGPRPGEDFGEIFGQRFKKTGAPIGTEFRINTYTTIGQLSPAVAFGKSFVVAWQSYGQDGNLSGIYAQRLQPSCLPGDANGDGSVNVTDVFYAINNLFAAGPAVVCGDANGDGTTNVTDVFHLINFLFAGGAPPV
jgi:hypothetical protein